MKTYEIEIASTTYRTYSVDAESQDEAETKAFQEVDADWEISKAWRQNAEITHVEEIDPKLDNLNKDL